MRRLNTIDAHAGGEPLRLIVAGFPSPRGRTMLDKAQWLKKRHEPLRRALMLEPRGHADMCGALLTEPIDPHSHAGLIVMHQAGYASMSGHAVIAATTIALERRLIVPGGDGRTIVFDTPAGTVRAVATWDDAATRVMGVAFVNVPSFVMHAGAILTVGTKRVRADIAFGGAVYAIVDSEAIGVPLDAVHVPELRAAGVEVMRAVSSAYAVVHPEAPGLGGPHGAIFTGPPHGAGADLRAVTVFADGRVSRSPSGTGAASVMAVLDAMGVLEGGGPFVQEGLIETQLVGRRVGRTKVGDYEAIVPEISGSAWITGEHTFLVDDHDPLKGGFRI